MTFPSSNVSFQRTPTLTFLEALVGPIDRLMKFITQQRPGDMVRLFRPDAKQATIVDLSKSQVRLDRTDVDELLLVQNDEGQFLLHLEFIAEWRPDDPYVSLSKAARAREQYPKMPVVSVALVFRAAQASMPRERIRIDWSQPPGQCIFTLEVLRIGQEEAAHLLESPLPALWAMVPFSKGGTAREWVQESADRIRNCAELTAPEQADLLAAIHIGLDHKGVLSMLQDIIGEDAIENSTLFRTAYSKGEAKGLEKGREKGLEEGYREIQDELLFTLSFHIGPIDAPLEASVRRLKTSRALATVMVELGHCSSDEDYLKMAERLRRMVPPQP